MLRILSVTLFVTAIVLSSAAVQAKPALTGGNLKSASIQQGQAREVARLVRTIRRELVTLPFYDVFDWLEGDVRADGTVVLRGQVVRPTTKSSAENVVKDIEGVERVVNEIEVLPLSPNDDRIRIAVYRELFNFNSPLFRYATQAVPPIHIIVKNGRVTLKGVVANKGDSDLANIRARTVPGVFEVTNQLQVEQQAQR
jgi:hyperosmotically inducible periplasmic protein